MISQCIQSWVCASALGAGIGTVVSQAVTFVVNAITIGIPYAITHPTYGLECGGFVSYAVTCFGY